VPAGSPADQRRLEQVPPPAPASSHRSPPGAVLALAGLPLANDSVTAHLYRDPVYGDVGEE